MKTNDWLITLPKTFPWNTFMTEMAQLDDGSTTKRFKIPARSTITADDALYILHDGYVRGYLHVRRVSYMHQGFTCSTTGTYWAPGTYAECEGPWVHCPPRPFTNPMRGFQGLRHYTPAEVTS